MNLIRCLQLFGVILVFTFAPISEPKESIIWDILFHSSFSSNGDQTDFPDDCWGWLEPAILVVPFVHEDDISLSDLSSDVGVYGSLLPTIKKLTKWYIINDIRFIFYQYTIHNNIPIPGISVIDPIDMLSPLKLLAPE